MSLVLRSEIGRRLSIAEMDGNFNYLQQIALSGTTSNISNYTEVTYSDLKSSIDSNGLNTGSYYLITDFKTCYDQPDYDIYGYPITEGNYKVGNTHSILVFATSENTISTDAWQPDFPKDIIKYDYSWTQSEITSGTAYGRITERIDEWNNRTDYDHRDILFKRYDTFAYYINEPISGTISVTNGVVSGVDTVFTDFSIGDIIAIPYFSELFFKIDSISGATAMSLTGSIWDVTAGDIKFYSIDYNMERCSYKKNNVDNTSYEISTFGDAIENGGAFNNYIGDHANSYYFDEIGDFLLSNNVFLNGVYNNNNLGNNCYNNTFDDDCTNNTIGNFFRKNITDDDFDGNHIGNYFENNLITSNFQRNIVGENFEGNYIVVDSFYRNRISEQFENNKISGNSFQNNIIGNAFRENQINCENDGFLKNIIGVGFNNNTITNGEFDSNTFGNGVNNNNFHGNIYENKIGDYFYNNSLGSVLSTISFYENQIGNDFDSNNVYRDFNQNIIFNSFYNNSFYNDFYRNYIGYDFENNTIGDSEDVGDAEFYQNKIGNRAKGNLFIGDNYVNEYSDDFYSNELLEAYGNKFGYQCFFNTLGDYFVNNTIGNYFSNNIIGNNTGYNNIGDEFYGNNIVSDFSYNNIANYFNNNTIGINFAYNNIGNYFESNTIEDDFGFGGSQPRGNKIGNYFTNNSIAEYFYDNNVADIVNGCTMGNYFQLNNIKTQNLYNYDFTTNLHKIVGISFSASGSSATDGTYSNISGATTSSINGVNATFDISVNGGEVTSVNINAPGKLYEINDSIRVLGTQIGGTNVTDDISITITEVYIPSVYGYYNCDIFKRKDGEYRLSFYDESDTLAINDIDE
jgi:hypothetical protein